MPILTKINTNVIADNAVTSAKIPADAVLASEIAAGAVSFSELDTATGIESTHHKVPAYADAAARNTAIPSPANGMIIYNTEASALQQYNGAWAAIVPAPAISSLSGFLNEDTDSTITVFGSNFNSSSTVKMFGAASGGSQVGSNATTTFNSVSKLTAVFGAGSLGSAGDTVYIEVDNSGVSTRFATAITLNADPTVVHAGATGTSSNTTTHLGTYGGAGVGGGDDSNTIFLLNFDRGGGKDIEDSSNTGNDGHRVTTFGEAHIKASPFGDGKTAIKFDGSGDSLTIPDSDDFDFGTGAFTIECWFQADHITGSAQTIMSRVTDSGNDSVTWMLRHTSGALEFTQNNTSGSDHEISAYPVVAKSWTHLAITRQSDSYIKIFADGELIYISAATDGGNNYDAAGALWIGRNPTGGQDYEGYIDEIRVVKGVAVYTGNFTVPTSRLATTQSAGTNIAAITGTATKLLIHSNLSSTSTSFTDSSSSGRTITAVNQTKHSTLYNHAESTVLLPAMTWPASGKSFGSYGAYFDGDGDYLKLDDDVPSLAIGSGDFTVDCWAYSTIAPSGAKVFWAFDGPSGADAIYFRVQSSTQLNLSINESATNITWTPTYAFTANVWRHVAVVRASGVVTIYINGVSIGNNGQNMAATISPAPSGFTIAERSRGNGGSGGQYWTGYIDQLRFSKTARWTSNFTPETAPYGATLSQTIPTITFTGTATQLAADEDIEFTAVENSSKADGSRSFIDTNVGLVLANLTGDDKSKATLTGTITSASGTTHTNMPLKLQVRKTLATAAYANASRTVTFSGSETTAGLSPAMPVSGTGIPANTTITTVDTSTTITLSANPTGGTLTGQDLIFLDLTRVSHQYNGSDTINNADAMYTLATGTGGDPVLFNARRYMGTGVTRLITGFGFQPDLIWIKNRERANYEHSVFDSVRGVSTSDANQLIVNGDGAEGSAANMVEAIIPDGFRLGIDTAAAYVNYRVEGHIAWAWKAGGAPSGAGKTMTDGTETTISSSATFNASADMYDTDHFAANGVTRSVNTAGKFSITKIVNPSSTIANRGVPHGLGTVPSFVIVKPLDTAGWDVFHTSLPSNTSLNNKYLVLNTSAATGNVAGGTTAASNYHFFLANNAGWDMNEANIGVIIYAWKAVAGVSAFGTYEGGPNGSEAKTTLDFRPKWIMVKEIDTGSGYSSWTIIDAFRTDWGTGTTTLTSGNAKALYANLSKVENQRGGTSTSVDLTEVTIYDDGFKMTAGNADVDETNLNGQTYIYAAFA